MKHWMAAVGIILVGMPAAAIARDDQAVIRSLIERKYEKQNACDPSYAENYTTADATELLPNDMLPHLKDSPESVAEFRAMCEAGGSFHNEVEIHSIDLVTDDVALVIGHGQLRMMNPDGGLEMDGRYNFSEVFVRTTDGWRVRHLQVALIIPDVPMVPTSDSGNAGIVEPNEELTYLPSGDTVTSQAEHDRRIDYIEFPVPDLEEAKRFYASVFGWSFTDYGPDYTSFADGRLAGGFRNAESVQPGGPLVVIYALDLEKIAETVTSHGGIIVTEIFEFPGGERFHFRDPSGSELAVWSDR